MRVYFQQRAQPPQRCKVRGDRVLPENSKYPVLEYKHSSDISMKQFLKIYKHKAKTKK